MPSARPELARSPTRHAHPLPGLTALAALTALTAASLLAGALGGCMPGEEESGVEDRPAAEMRAAPASDLAAEERAIRDADAAMLRAARAGDADEFAAAFASDGRLLFPYAPAAEGRMAIRERFAENSRAPGFDVRWTTRQVEVSAAGDLAWSTGRYTLAMETPDGPVRDEGKFLSVWEKVGGEWKMAADMIATDLPPGATGPTGAPGPATAPGDTASGDTTSAGSRR